MKLESSECFDGRNVISWNLRIIVVTFLRDGRNFYVKLFTKFSDFTKVGQSQFLILLSRNTRKSNLHTQQESRFLEYSFNRIEVNRSTFVSRPRAIMTSQAEPVSSLRLKSKDGEVFEVEKPVAMHITYVKSLLDGKSTCCVLRASFCVHGSARTCPYE